MKIISFIISMIVFNACKAQNKITDHVYTYDNKSLIEKVDIDNFKLLEGNWKGYGLGGDSDEIWLPPRDGKMHGIFRLEDEGKLVFTEYMSILEDSISYVMKIKHFNPDMTGWEEKEESTEFRYLFRDKDILYFSGLTAERSDESSLNIYVAFKQEDGSHKEEKFTFTKN